jgi:hypothetical protein
MSNDEHQIRGSPHVSNKNVTVYLLYFAPARKLFELKRLTTFVLCLCIAQSCRIP